MNFVNDIQYTQKGDNALSKQNHSHNDAIEILHVIRGSGTIVINNRLFELSDNSIYFINSMDFHTVSPNDVNYTRNIINISSEYMDKLFDTLNATNVYKKLFDNPCLSIDKSISDLLSEEVKRIKIIASKDDVTKEIEITSHILNLIRLVIENNTANEDLSDSRITAILEYINKNISNKLTLDEISNNCFISKYYLCKIFKNYTHMSVMSYIIQRRISIAKELIISTNKPFSQISLETGFSSFAYFSNIFKKYENITPSEFKKKYKEK